jgi:hypothetical protein
VQFSPTQSYRTCPNGQSDCGTGAFCVSVPATGGPLQVCLLPCA